MAEDIYYTQDELDDMVQKSILRNAESVVTEIQKNK